MGFICRMIDENFSSPSTNGNADREIIFKTFETNLWIIGKNSVKESLRIDKSLPIPCLPCVQTCFYSVSLASH